MSQNFSIQKQGVGNITATINDYKSPGDTVSLSRRGNKVTATYLPPANLTSGVAGNPETLSLTEARDIIADFPEIAVKHGFAMAVELSLADAAKAVVEDASAGEADDPMGALMRLLAPGGLLDPTRADALADLAKAKGFYR
jgi:hypothetical protein